ncbi:MAG TPA: TIGR00725 family protein [Thermoanaerobaculia bacterium]
MPRSLQIAVVGAAACDTEVARLARDSGAELALAGITVLTGGRGGVMQAACEGARLAGGRTVGILPGVDDYETPANEYLDVVLHSGLNQARNQIVVLSAAAVIAIGGGWGTLSEIAFALKFRVPVVLLASWKLRRPDGLGDPLLFTAQSPGEAVKLALHASGRTTPA